MIRFTAPVNLVEAAKDDDEEMYASPRIAGVAVPWDVTAVVSGGQKVRFQRGAFDVNQKAAKLVENHDLTQLRGVVNKLEDTDTGLRFEATLANTAASRDAVELLKAGAYDSVSVGANPTKFKFDKTGTMIVSKADLIELSLVAVPAFADAVITEIAASADPEDDENQPTDTPEEENVSEEIKAEAQAPATHPVSPIVYATAKKAVELPTAVEYLSAAIAGGSAWHEMREAIKAAAPDVVTTDTPGILPTPILGPVYNNFVGRRPVVDAVGVKAMPGGGKVFIRPEVTTHTSMAAQSSENAALQAGTYVVFNNQVTKQAYGGYVTISEQDLDWTDPNVLSLILDDMGRIYANTTDNVAADNLASGATTTSNFTAASVGDPAVWAAWVAGAAATILSASNGNLPTHMFVAPGVWQDLLGLADTADRPLFPQIGPMNAFGNLTPGSASGNAFGLQVVVDRNFASGTLIVGCAPGFEIFEQQKGAISIDNPSTISRTIAWRGYFATLMIDASKFVKAAFV